MTTDINPNLVPLVNPGSLFYTLTSNTSLAVRWLQANDPHYFDVYNRPIADTVLRQLIIAKTLDNVGLRLSHQSVFPFLIPCLVDVSTSQISLPVAWLWDVHVCIKQEYKDLRLTKIIRLDGENNPSAGTYTGTYRLVFGALSLSSSLIDLFYADYKIDSSLSFQVFTIKPATLAESSNPIPTSEYGTLSGYVVFRTLDIETESTFFDALAPGTGVVTGTSGTSDDPQSYEIADTVAGGTTVLNDYSYSAIVHGTGMLVPSAYNIIPPAGVDSQSILEAVNFPWREGTNLSSVETGTSVSTIPTGLFNQFYITAPAGNRDSSALEDNFPIYLTKIRRLNSTATELQLFFSTYNTIVGSKSTELIEFAVLTISSDGKPGDVLEIEPYRNLRNNTDENWQLFFQNFGSGIVILSNRWSTNIADIQSFFNSFADIVDEPADRSFNAQLGEFAISRSPLNVPTLGENSALAGSSARRLKPVHPSDENRYVTELDQGLGDVVDFITEGFTSNSDISCTGYTGSLIRKMVVLKVNTSNDANFNYDDDILPRLRRLLGRDPIMGDEWFDGTTFKRFDSTSGVWIG